MEIVTFNNGEVVVRQGDHGDCMYFIHSGTIGVFREYGSEYENRIAELGPGAFIGEMELIDKGRRSATCVVLSESAELERITHENYMDYFEKNPLQVYLIMKQLSGRLRETTKNYTDACRTIYELLRNAETGKPPSVWLQENKRRFSGVYLNRGLTRPVKKAADGAAGFPAGNRPAEQKPADQDGISDDIGKLAGSIDQMDDQVKQYIAYLTRITAEKERIAADLSLASRIQEAMLPHTFPPFPDRQEFELYADMDPAKAVGGDFYDFFLIDEDHLCMVIADVSGKGIPAALFMMNCKTILKSCTMLGRSVAEVLEKTNETVSSNNPENMFVTAWIGILEISTGRLKAASAGHEYPALKRAGGDFELLKDRHGLPIGAMEKSRYREYELQFEPDDALFLYTDGVPEAMDTDNCEFGTDRMLAALNLAPDSDPEALLQNVRKALDVFVGAAEQFDDITMLGFVYRGKG